VGLCTCLLLIVLSKRGSDLFDEANDIKIKQGNRTVDDPSLADNIVKGLDCILSLYSWYRYSEYFLVPNVPLNATHQQLQTIFHNDPITTKMRSVIDIFVECFPRPTKKDESPKEYYIQNLHSLLHVSRDIFLFGSPMNTDAGICEKNLKAIAKNPSKGAGKQESKFEESTANRLSEMVSVDKSVYAFTKRWGPSETVAQAQIDSLLSVIPENDGVGRVKVDDDGTEKPEVEKRRRSKDVYANVGPIMSLDFFLDDKRGGGWQLNGKLLKKTSVFSLVSGMSEYIIHHWIDIQKMLIRNHERKYPTAKPLTDWQRSRLYWYSLHKTDGPIGETFRAHPNIEHRGFWSWVQVKGVLYLVSGFFKLAGTKIKYVLLAKTTPGPTDQHVTNDSKLATKHTFQYIQLTGIQAAERNPNGKIVVPEFSIMRVEQLNGLKKEVVASENEPEVLLRHASGPVEAQKRDRNVTRLHRMRTEWLLSF